MNLSKILFLVFLGIFSMSSCNNDDDVDDVIDPVESPSIVVEITTFNLNTGVDANAFEIRDTEIEQDFEQNKREENTLSA